MERIFQQALIEALAITLGAKRNAVHQWRWRGAVPHKWRLPILAAARERKIKLPETAFDEFSR